MENETLTNQEKASVAIEVNYEEITCSLDVAKYFAKRHNNVVRDIRNLIKKEPSLGLIDFKESNYLDSQGISQPCYEMNHKGLVLLTMGYTGEKALQHKLTWLELFDRKENHSKRSNDMDQEILTNQEKVPVVTVVNHTATALSTDVATYFEKRHDNVVRDIENLRSSLPSDRLLDFEETVVTRMNPSGGLPIKSKAYRMTRDGFVLLVMGWTGEKALQFKLAWLDAFNRMEAQLKGTVPPTLTPAQQRGIQVAVAQRAGKNQLLYHALYRELKNHFNVASYKQIPFDSYDTAIAIINNADLERVVEDARTSSASSGAAQSDAILDVLASQWDNMAKVIESSAEVLRYLRSQKQAEPKPAIAQEKPKLQKHDGPDETSVSKKEEPVEDEIQYDLNLQFSAEKRTQHMSMAISPTLADKFKRFAKAQELSVNEAVNRALERFLERA